MEGRKEGDKEMGKGGWSSEGRMTTPTQRTHSQAPFWINFKFHHSRQQDYYTALKAAKFLLLSHQQNSNAQIRAQSKAFKSWQSKKNYILLEEHRGIKETGYYTQTVRCYIGFCIQ